MKATGIVRKLDQLGRIVLPKELRKTLHIEMEDPLEIFVDGDDVVLRKYRPGCYFCGSVDNLFHVGKWLICKSCAEKITAGLAAETQESGEAGTGEASHAE